MFQVNNKNTRVVDLTLSDGGPYYRNQSIAEQINGLVSI